MAAPANARTTTHDLPLACPSADQKELKDRGVTVSFGQASKPFVLDAYGTGPIATVLNGGGVVAIWNQVGIGGGGGLQSLVLLLAVRVS